MLVMATLIGAVGGVVSARLAPKNVVQKYKAEQVVVANQLPGSDSSVSQDSLRVTRGQVPELAANSLGTPEEADALAATIEVTANAESRTFTVTTTDVDPDQAQKRVGAFVDAFLKVINSSRTVDEEQQLKLLQNDVDVAKKNLADFDALHPNVAAATNLPGNVDTQQLISQRNNLVQQVTIAQGNLRRMQLSISETRPYETLGPEQPRLADDGLLNIPTAAPVRASLLGLLGLMLGAVIALVIERVQRRIDTRDELAQLVDLPVLAEIGMIPEKRRAGSESGQVVLDGVWAEPYRRVRSAVQYVQLANADKVNPSDTPVARRETPPLSVMLTSTGPSEGKSTSTALTGLALAELGTPTLVVGADFRRPEIHHMLGVEEGPTIRDLADNPSGDMTVVDVVHETSHRDLYLAPAGSATRDVSTAIGATKRVVREALSRGVMVLIDSSPLQVANDTLDLLPTVDYVILVVRSGASSADDVTDTIETLRRLSAKILGVIIVGTPSVGRKQASYYDYYAATDLLVEQETANHAAELVNQDAANGTVATAAAEETADTNVSAGTPD